MKRTTGAEGMVSAPNQVNRIWTGAVPTLPCLIYRQEKNIGQQKFDAEQRALAELHEKHHIS